MLHKVIFAPQTCPCHFHNSRSVAVSSLSLPIVTPTTASTKLYGLHRGCSNNGSLRCHCYHCQLVQWAAVRQFPHVSARVRTCQHVSARVRTCQHVSARVSTCPHVSARVSTCQHVSAREFVSLTKLCASMAPKKYTCILTPTCRGPDLFPGSCQRSYRQGAIIVSNSSGPS
jgi:hypothetical protein